MLRRRVVVFFPHNLYPPQSGFHKRGLEILSGLKEIGCSVNLLSFDTTAQPAWNNESIRALKARFVDDVHTYDPDIPQPKHVEIFDNYYIKSLEWYYKLRKTTRPFNSSWYCPPKMQYWSNSWLRRLSPDAIVMNYACWDRLIDHRKFKNTLKIIDTIDLLTLNRQMWLALEKDLPPSPIKANEVSDQILEEDFFERLNLQALPEEFQTYDNYNYTIAISRREAELIEQRTARTKVMHIPMTQQPHQNAVSYAGPALLATGPNPFNIQGYLYFVKRVLPLVRRRVNSFRLQVTGYCDERRVCPEPGVILSGFVPDLASVYESARFVVCPIFGGTGQQVKIVEAMSHGVPVVALQKGASSSPIQHGVNGLIAADAQEFAEYVVQLWSDMELCRQFGAAARETIANDFSRDHLLNSLATIMHS